MRQPAHPNLVGALCALTAVLCFSLNDVGIKFLSGDYALHQIVFFRTLVAIVTFAAVFLPIYGLQVFRTRRPGAHLLRGLCVVAANTCLFLGLAAMPIADAVAVFFISPLVITIFSILFLREHVGARRWTAIAVGFAGVLVIVKPGTSAFQVAALLPMAAAVLYAVIHVVARRVGGTESAATMAVYIQLTFLVACSLIGLGIGDGRFADQSHPSLAFLFRAWGPIDTGDWWILIMLGASGLLGGFFISQAYRVSEAAFAAPFEYVALPMAIFWGVTVFGTWPDASAWIGIFLILTSGLYLIWRETSQKHAPEPERPAHR